MNDILCWHFAGSTLRDGSPLPRKGETRTLPEGEAPVLRERGWHGSVRAIDALGYAPGPMVARVRLHGVVLTSDDKVCATARTNETDYFDATDALRAFARRQALSVAHLWSMPDAVRRYLETGDDALRAAAWAAAWVAACHAAGAAARAAARDAARDAAWAAASDAARDAANVDLEAALTAAMEEA